MAYIFQPEKKTLSNISSSSLIYIKPIESCFKAPCLVAVMVGQAIECHGQVSESGRPWSCSISCAQCSIREWGDYRWALLSTAWKKTKKHQDRAIFSNSTKVLKGLPRKDGSFVFVTRKLVRRCKIISSPLPKREGMVCLQAEMKLF